MAYEIRNCIISGLPRDAYRKGIGAYEGVVGHSTATPEATDEAETGYFHNNWNKSKAFPHFVVDWDSITQLADTNYGCWAGGPSANNRFVQVELCETKDPDKFTASYTRYVWLLAKLLKDKYLGVVDGETLWSHDCISKTFKETDHTDPIGYLKSHGVSWEQVVKDIQESYNSSIPYKVIIPNVAFWQARNLVFEFEKRKFKCYGKALKTYGPNEKAADKDPYWFVVETDLENAKYLVIELKMRGYDQTYGEEIK